MGHQTHFLERLERFSHNQARFALSLYYDSELVEATMKLAALPPEADRVAVDLGTSGRGPYILLTRNGRFVTCLAEGMTTGNLPIVRRKRYLKLLARVKEQRRREMLERSRGGLDSLVGRLFDTRLLAREDFDALSSHVPEGSLVFLTNAYASWEDVERGREFLLAGGGRNRGASTARLRSWTVFLRSIGPQLTLSALDPAALDAQLPKEAKGENSGAHRVYMGLRPGVFDLAAQALWAAGRQGNLLWAPLTRGLPKSDSRLSYISRAAALCCSALRYPRRLPATRHLLLNPLSFEHAGEQASLLETLHAELAPIWEEILYFPDQCIEAQRALGSRLLDAAGIPIESSGNHASNDLALTAAVQLNRGDFLNDGGALVDLLRCIPWLASVDARELYLPESELVRSGAEWTLDDSRLALTRWEKFWGKRVPDVRVRQAKPNDQCPCGSKRKFKRCCDSGTTATPEFAWWERTARAA